MGMSEIIKKMKVFLQNEIPTEEIQEVKMTDVKTKDGMILSFDGELAPGIEIYIVDESGRNPASDGEYILEDGQILDVEGGMIKEIKVAEEPIEAPTEVIPVEEMAIEAPTEEKPIEEEEDLKAKVKKLEEDFKNLSAILSELATEMGKTELKSEIKEDLKLSRVQEAKPVQKFNKNTQLDNILTNMYRK